MISLRQRELKEWQERNFGPQPVERLALGMAEEVGEVCHHILKGLQGIRGGVNGINRAEVADGVADVFIYGINLLSAIDMDAEATIDFVTDLVLQRNWKDNPGGKNIPKQGKGA